MWDQNNIFLNGPFTPLQVESFDPEVVVEGEIPPDLQGTFYRVGSSTQFAPIDPTRYHWFDGDGMVYAITLKNGGASFRNRWVRSLGFEAERKFGHAIYGGFMNGGKPRMPPPGLPPMKNPGNTNVTVFDNRLLVFCEGDVPHDLAADTLETLGQYNYGGAIHGPVTAHFKIDPGNGDMLFFGAMGPSITWYRADKDGQLLEKRDIVTGVPAFHHDFAVTDNYAIFFITPAVLNFPGLMHGEPSTVWNPEVKNRVALLNRKTGNVSFIELAETFSITHFLNAYEEDGHLIIDANRTPTFAARIGERNPFDLAFPWRWDIDLADFTATSRQMGDFNSEFPRHNDAFTGRKHRYGYYAATQTGAFCQDWLFDNLAKHDVVTGNVEFQDMAGELTSPGEPVFVPRPGSTDEDDGWVISFWWNEKADTTEVVIQDAKSFSAPPLARLKLKNRIPMGFHGNWVGQT